MLNIQLYNLMDTRIKLSLLSLIVCAWGVQAQEALSLDACRALAIENNKVLKISSEKEQKAHYERKAALAQYLPDFSLTGGYIHRQKNFSLLDADRFLPIGTLMPDGSFGFRPDQINNQWADINGQKIPLDAGGQPFNPHDNPEKILWKDYTTIPRSEFEMDSRNMWTGVFSVAQPIYMGGKIVAYNQIAKYAEQLARSQKDTELQQVILQTDEAYWQTISLVHKKRLTSSYVELLRRMDADVQLLIQEGLATKADGLSIKVKLNEAEIAETKVENGLRMTRMLLAQICGLPLETELALVDEQVQDFDIQENSIVAVDVEQAYLDRPELKSLNLATKIYEKKETIVRSEMLPTVALSANYTVTNPNMFNGFQKEFAGMWNVGVVVKVPLFHWGEKANHLNAAKAETRIKRLETEDAKEKVALQINQSIFQLNEAERKMIMAQRNKESAAENLQYANWGFEEGVIPVLQVMEAQSAWLKANSEWIDAQIESKLAHAYLKKATGK